MTPFTYERGAMAAAAGKAAAAAIEGMGGMLVRGRPPVEFLAGGTTLIDLMKLEAMQPRHLVDIKDLRTANGAVEVGPEGLRIGALATMAEVAHHPGVVESYPVIAQTLVLAASAQLRNMASVGGNVLQRTRCPYFRDVAWANCNKREPGSGCAALDGFNRLHAVLGASETCIATYPGDFAQALIALDATVETTGPNGARRIDFADLHRTPGDTPHVETSLTPGEVITALAVPAGSWTRRSLYLKIRDRQSYEFALASAAVALDLAGGTVRQARVALGGVATVPWRAREAEALLKGKPLDEAAAIAAAAAAFSGARAREHNGFKIALGQRTLVRALLQAATMEG